jgi:hypothetical protein
MINLWRKISLAKFAHYLQFPSTTTLFRISLRCSFIYWVKHNILQQLDWVVRINNHSKFVSHNLFALWLGWFFHPPLLLCSDVAYSSSFWWYVLLPLEVRISSVIRVFKNWFWLCRLHMQLFNAIDNRCSAGWIRVCVHVVTKISL